MFIGIFAGAGVLFVGVLILSLSSGTRTAKVSAPEGVQFSPSSYIANRPAKSPDYRDPKTAKQIIDSLGR
jgi:hypothetical protein